MIKANQEYVEVNGSVKELIREFGLILLSFF